MTKSGLSYFKWAPFAVLLATAFTVSMRSSTAKIQSAPVVDSLVSVDLANEERIINKYCDDFFAYETQSEELVKRATLVIGDVDSLQRRSDELKRRLSEVQNAVGEVVRKLKAANEWDDLGRRVAAKITDSRLKSLVSPENVTRDLEDDANNLAVQADEISIPVDKLRKRLTSRLSSGADLQTVQAAYVVPATLGKPSLGCRIGLLGIRIVTAVGGTPSPAQADRVINRCSGNLLNPF